MFSSNDSIEVKRTGRLTGNGTINGHVSNAGLIDGFLTINGNTSVADIGRVGLEDTLEHLSFNGNLVFESNFATSNFELFNDGSFDRWTVAGDANLGGNLNVDGLTGFSSDFNQEFQIIDVNGNSTGNFSNFGEGSLVGNFGGQDLFISYNGGDGNDTVLFTEQVPQWIGGTGSWHDATGWLNGVPTPTSSMVLIDNDAATNSFVSTAGGDATIQNLRVDTGDTLFVERGSNGQGRLTFDSSPSGAPSSSLTNNGLVQVGNNISMGFSTDFEITGSGTMELLDPTTVVRQSSNDLTLVNGTGHRIEGQGRIESKNIQNFGLIDANVATGSLSNLTITGQFAGSGSGFRDGFLNNQGIIRASNGGGLLIDIRETDGGVFEAAGPGSRVHFNANKLDQAPSTVVRDATFRTSNGGIITAETDDERVLFLDNLTNQGRFQARNVRLFNSLDNSGHIQLLNSNDENISLGGDLSISGNGNGVIDFLQGGMAFTSQVFELSIDSNQVRGLGTFDVAATHLGDSLILDPSRSASSIRPEVGVFEFLSETTLNGSHLIIDMYGDGVASGTFGDPSDPDSSILNIFRDDSFSERGLDQANIEYDQINVFDTLIIDDDLELSIMLQDGYIPEIGEFHDLITADQIFLNGLIALNAPVINDLTFDYEILNLFDPGAGFNREVVRVTFGAAVVPEPSSAVALMIMVGILSTCRRRRSIMAIPKA